ncbi:MAG: glycosyltransferase family 4 protein [Thermoplasmata archaeon]
MQVVLLGAGQRPIPPAGHGGIERFVGDLAAALRGAGHGVVVVNEGPSGLYADGWAFARSLLRRIPGAAADDAVVHANTSEAAIVLGLAGRPYVYTTHFPRWEDPTALRDRAKESLAVRWAAASTGFTPALVDRLRGVRARRGEVVEIPLGVDTDRFCPGASARERVALGVGEVHPRKRWPIAARAARRAGVPFRLIGPIADRSLADALADEGAELLGEVPVSRLLSELQAARVLLHPSDREAMPGAVLQALACGTPVAGGGTLAGISGPLAAPSDDARAVEEHLVSVLRRLLADPEEARREGVRARAAAVDRYAWPVVIARYEAVYRRCTGGGPWLRAARRVSSRART